MADKKIIAELEVQTGRSKQNLASVTEELAKTGDAGVKNSSAITHALENIENATAKVIQKETEGRLVTEKDGKLIIQQYDLLTAAVKRFEQENGAIPPALQAALGTARSQFDLAASKIRNATDAVQDNNQILKEGEGRYLGLGESINKVIGPAGKFQVGAIAIGAALREGIQLGTSFAQTIGTNFSAAQSASDNLKASIGGVTNALVTDGLWAAFAQSTAAAKFLDDSITGSGNAIKGYNIVVNAGVDRTRALEISADDLKNAVNAYTLAQQGGTEGLKLFNQTVTKTDTKELGVALDSISAKLKQLAIDEDTARVKREAHVKAIEATTAALKSEIDKLEAERVAREHGKPAIDAEIEDRERLKKALVNEADAAEHATHVKSGLTEEMRTELEHLKNLSADYEHNTKAVDGYVEALKEDLETHKDAIDPARRAEIENIIKLAEELKNETGVQQEVTKQKLASAIATLEASAHETRHTEIVRDATGAYTNLTEEEQKDAEKKREVAKEAASVAIAHSDQLTPALNLTKEGAKELETALNKLGSQDKGSAFGHVSEAVQTTTGHMKELNTEITTLIGSMETLLSQAIKIEEGLKRVGTAAAQAAGTPAASKKSEPPPVVPGNPSAEGM